ncbi:hypothetical protein EXE53_00070 [Halorubrum sp. SD626R]|uniref:hypothetical protein n=1 Tax=Halorubrum sp. SD626R TaxID=1419722 RepID=UPI0010F60C33|nr:hypothetical protein [Halorubrum sp. SD626R]TKX82044.1 hypothetical protein EXE53_00070 [Halorubrum sp. SD626R]
MGQVDDIDGALTRLLFLPIAAFFIQAANAVEAISNVFINPLGAFAGGLESIVRSLLGDGAAGIIEAGAEASQADISLFGIGGFPVSLAVVFAGAFVLSWYLSRQDTSDTIPFSFTDIPFLGVEEDPEEG